MELIHTCYRITDPERSLAFYEALGLEKRRELPIREEAINYFLGVPGREAPELELTYNFEPPEDGYDIETGYGHIALTVDDLDATLGPSRGERHRTRASSLPSPRRRLAHRFRQRSGRLQGRTDRAQLSLRAGASRTLRVELIERG